MAEFEYNKPAEPPNPGRRKAIKAIVALGVSAFLQQSSQETQPTQIVSEVKPLPKLPFIPFAKNSFQVYLPGVTGGGPWLTGLRQFYEDNFGRDNVRVLPSLSTPFALQKGEDAEKHYQNEAEIIARLAGERTIHLTGHSLGGNEAELLVKALLEKWHPKGQKLEMVFYAVPGFAGEKEAAGTIAFFLRFNQLLDKASLLEQHVAYPLPEDLQRVYKPLNLFPKGIDKAFSDTPQEREGRRNRFSKIWLPELAKQTGLHQDQLLRDLEDTETRLRNGLDDPKQIAQLLRERGKLLSIAIEGIFRGAHIERDIQMKHLSEYHELKDQIVDSLSHTVHGLPVLAAKTQKDLFQGFDASIQRIVQRCERAGVTPLIYPGFFENDVIARTTDLPRMLQRLTKRGLGDNLGGVFGVDTFAHSSLAYEQTPLKTQFSPRG